MKTFKLFICIIGLVSLFLAGCSNDIQHTEQSIVVEKRIGVDNNYEEFRENTDNEEVQRVVEMLSDINWIRAHAEMAYPPDYKFSFRFTNPNMEAKAVVYQLWITPNKENVELISDSGYVKLDEDLSAELFELVTGEVLAEQ